jgi:hypothetical protein
MNDPIETIHKIDSEIVIGLVGALGTDLARVRDLVSEALVQIRYDAIHVKISKQVIPLFGAIEYEEGNESNRIEKMMDAGNSARKRSMDQSVLDESLDGLRCCPKEWKKRYRRKSSLGTTGS